MALQGVQAQRTAARKTAEYLKKLKAGITAERITAIAEEKLGPAETLARQAIASKVQKILNRVAKATREGRLDANNLDIARVQEIVGEGLSDYSAEIVMRNAMVTAYNAGYYDQGRKDNTKQFWLYQTRLDRKVRPAHARWEGLLLAKNDPLVKQIFPPNGFACRCRMVAVNKVVAAGLIGEGKATTEKPEIKYVDYVDKVTGKTIKTIEGVDPGYLGLPNDSEKEMKAVLERQLQKLADWTPSTATL
jgi:SPP1 gp7 family putative phage head morphogenesis protein